MARLAAYYQEDFHYPLKGPGHKQRKSAYVVYEEPKNNIFNSYSFNKERIRGLATSEPSLDFSQLRPEVGSIMPLQQRVYQQQGQVYQNHPYHFDNVSNIPPLNHHFAGYEPEIYDNESVLSYNEFPQHGVRYNQRYKSRPRKRFSYAEPSDLHSTDIMYLPQNIDTRHINESLENSDFQYYDDRHFQPDNYYVEPISQCQSSPMYFRPESRQGHWQKHPFIQTNANPVFLSPPSPLDSGLSSQSIGSNPSLDVEHSSEHLPTMRSGRHSACSCARLTYCDNRRLNSHDFSRNSPGSYELSHRAVALPQRLKGGTSNRRRYSTEDYSDVPPQCESQVRYGKLGLIGEPTDSKQRAEDNQDLDNFNKQKECDSRERIRYAYSDESDVPQRRTTAQRRKKSPANKYTRPCVIVIEGPEKNGQLSPGDQEELSDDNKSQGPESPMSVTVSNSDSAPSSNELEEPPREKTPSKRRQSLNKTTESEIKELEEMYERCNLGDRDLLDRAERRDLPTAHQQVRLTRSRSSDVLCGTPSFRNPYEPLRRAPPLRRSGLPDRIADDMALRKLQKPHHHSRRHHNRLTDNAITYMLCSAHFTPTVPPAGRDFLFMGNPDVELDDLCYRKHYLGKEGKQEPEPPFGIPLRPPPHQKVNISDYLHAVPSRVPQPLCHPRGNPDVVRDDMAFRTLRKDEPERVYYDISQVYKHKNS